MNPKPEKPFAPTQISFALASKSSALHHPRRPVTFAPKNYSEYGF